MIMTDMVPAEASTESTVFRPSATFTQTCGHCGCRFQVEVQWARTHKDLQEYSCPECHHHPCIVHASQPPRLTILTALPRAHVPQRKRRSS